MAKRPTPKKSAANRGGPFSALRSLVMGADTDLAEDDDDGNGSDDDDGNGNGSDDDSQNGGDDNGGDDGSNDDDGQDHDDAADAGPAGQADPAHAQYQHGVAAANSRWAAVLGSANAQGRMGSALTLLAEPALSASKIVGMLANLPKDQPAAGGQPGRSSAAERLLARTPDNSIGSKGKQEGPDGAFAASDSRKRAAERASRAKKPDAGTRRGRNQED